MAITAEEVRSYPLSTDRKGYNMEEVDKLLDLVAEEIDSLTATVSDLRYQLDTQAPAAVPQEPVIDEEAMNASIARVRAEYDQQLAKASADLSSAAAAVSARDARINELEAAVAEAKADGNAIAQALIIAQRSADEILSNANAQAVQIIDDAKEDAANILARAEEDKQAVEDEIDLLKNDREDARMSYQQLLENFISDASVKLAGIVEQGGAHAKVAAAEPVQTDPSGTGRIMSRAQIPVRQMSADTYVTPQTGTVIPVAATPTPSKATKDLSGFGDTDSDFLFGDVD